MPTQRATTSFDGTWIQLGPRGIFVLFDKLPTCQRLRPPPGLTGLFPNPAMLVLTVPLTLCLLRASSGRAGQKLPDLLAYSSFLRLSSGQLSMYFLPLPRMCLGAGFVRCKHCLPLPNGQSTQIRVYAPPCEPADRRGRGLSLGWDGMGWAAGEQNCSPCVGLLLACLRCCGRDTPYH